MRRVPFFRTLDRVSVARLIGALEKVHFPTGSLIFSEGAEGDALYLIESGRVEVSVKAAGGERPLAVLEGPSHFGELGLLLERRTASVRAVTDVYAWRLPRHRFEQLVRERVGIGLAIATSLAERLDQRSREHVGAPAAVEPRPPMTVEGLHVRRLVRWRIVGTVLAVAVPLALWPLHPPGGLDSQGWHVSLIVLGAALAWLFEPLPDFVIALIMAAAWGMTGLAPLPLVFAGFTSSSWLVALGALALASAMARSGLLFRAALLLLRTFPATHAGQVLALLVGGFLITPLVPLATARVSAIAPLARELAEAMGYPPRGHATAALSYAGLAGYGGFSTIFLTGLAMNFFVIDLLPRLDRVRFDWLTWFVSAAAAGAVMLIGLGVVLLGVFRAEGVLKASPEVVRRQGRVLGPLSQKEWVTIAALTVLLAGLLLQPLIRIETAWLAIGTLAVIMVGGALDRETFRSSIDWGFLMLFGVLLGTGGVLRSVGVDRWIGDGLVALTSAVADRGALILLLAAFVVGCRLVLPRQPATLLLSLALVPAASQLGLAPWIVGFVVLLAANTWLHPSQSDWYRLTRDATEGEMFTDRHGLIMGMAVTVTVLIAIAASVPYWRMLGLLAP